MTIATLEQPVRYGFGTRYDRFWIRLFTVGSLVAADLVSFGLADSIFHLLGTPPAIALFGSRVGGAPFSVIDLMSILAVFFVVSRYIVGDYSRRLLFWDGARATTRPLLVCGLVYIAAVMMQSFRAVPVDLLVWAGLLFGLPAARQGARYLLSVAGLWLIPTAILGTNETAEQMLPSLSSQLALGLKVLWVVPETRGAEIPEAFGKLRPVMVPPEELVAALSAMGCRQVVLAPDDRLQMMQNDIIDQLIGADIRVAIVPSLRRLPLFGLSASYFFGKDFLLLQVRNNLARLPQRIVKRGMDIVGALVALILLSPVFAVLALLIKREDGGPVLFIQDRVGRHGRVFGCWKFRTMVMDAEERMARWAEEDPLLMERYLQSNFKLRADPRVTRIGAWMRRTSLDEVPQLINVLVGQMSLVGPRPLLARELPQYGAVISLYERVRPGITGLWQISGRSHTTFAERVSYDEWYIKNWTVWYDIVILLQTVWVLLRGEGAY